MLTKQVEHPMAVTFRRAWNDRGGIMIIEGLVDAVSPAKFVVRRDMLFRDTDGQVHHVAPIWNGDGKLVSAIRATTPLADLSLVNLEGTSSRGIDLSLIDWWGIVRGSNLDDTIRIASGSGRVHGYDGNDRLVGADNGDYLNGNAGDDVLIGRGGDDTLVGGAGDDLIDGGAGIDIASGPSIILSRTADEIVVYGDGVGRDTLRGIEFINRAYLGTDTPTTLALVDGTVVITTTEGFPDYALTGVVVNEVDGRLIATVNEGLARVDSGFGSHEVDITGAERLVFPEVWTDGTYIRGPLEWNGSAPIHIVSNIYSVSGGSGNDTLETILWDVSGPRDLYGRGGDDVLIGVLMHGGDGNDTLLAAGPRGYGDGGDGDDLINAPGAQGGSGNDRITNTRHPTSGSYFNGNDGDDFIWVNAGSDRVYGAAGADTVSGGAGNDTLSGGHGNDLLHNHSGDDAFDGGEGIDTLELFGSMTDWQYQMQNGEIWLWNTRHSVYGTDRVTGVEVFRFSDGTTIDVESLFPT